MTEQPPSDSFPTGQSPMPTPANPGLMPEQRTELNVISIIGFALAVTCSGFGIISLVLSIIGLVQINKEPQRYHGKGFAIAGIIISVVAMILFALYVLLLVLAVAEFPDSWSFDSDPSF